MNRFIDLLMLIVTAPVWITAILVISGLIILCDGFPVFFRQTRIGARSKPFTLFKFRTMVPWNEGGSVHAIADLSRVTTFGRWLRRRHFDELPQMFNILKGEMSFIGPRPEIPFYFDSSFKPIEHVLPGLIDSATVHWIDEDAVLSRVEDPDFHYRAVILPDKLARSAEDVAAKSVAYDFRLLMKALRIVCLGGKPTPKHENVRADRGRSNALSG